MKRICLLQALLIGLLACATLCFLGYQSEQETETALTPSSGPSTNDPPGGISSYTIPRLRYAP
jgi:hypothetical protein